MIFPYEWEMQKNDWELSTQQIYQNGVKRLNCQ